MAKGNLWDWVARSNALAAWTERGERAGRALGIHTRTKGLIVLAVGPIYAAASHIVVGHWSWWIATPLALVGATYALKLYAALRAAMAVRGLRVLELQQIGKDCVASRAEVMECLVGRVDAAPGRSIGASLSGVRTPEAMHTEWASNVDCSNQTCARTVQKFAHRALAISHFVGSDRD